MDSCILIRLRKKSKDNNNKNKNSIDFYREQESNDKLKRL
ncbi:unknown [Bacteroides sp. CAG:661]|nr:unknown [Bacteroides sp. CAG:661]